jgi:hypothetical protein
MNYRKYRVKEDGRRRKKEMERVQERGLKKKGRFEQPTGKYFPKPLLVKWVGQKSKG